VSTSISGAIAREAIGTRYHLNIVVELSMSMNHYLSGFTLALLLCMQSSA
jgi:hypothetical protein